MTKTTHIILGLAALLFSRATFLFIDDPEGPNLLIVVVFAVLLYLPSWGAYAYAPKAKIAVALATQVLLAGVLYFFLMS